MRLVTKKEEPVWIEIRKCRWQVLPPSQEKVSDAAKRNTKVAFDRKTHQRYEDRDNLGFSIEFYTSVIVGWDENWGDKILDQDGKPMPYNEDNLMLLIDLNTELVGEIIDAASDLSEIISRQDEKKRKNSKRGASTTEKS